MKLAAAFALATTVHAEEPKKIGWIEPVEKNIVGWTVSVDPLLLSGEHAKEGGEALKMLANHLQRVAIVVPTSPLAELRKVGIQIEWHHPELDNMQYHPAADWLVEHGYDPQLAKKVHIPRAMELVSREQMLKHPAVLLHELSHAYHDQVLGFDYAPIISAYDAAMKSGKYENVMQHDGRMVKHYATTNHKEYFAEATEAYLYRNDFYPFVAGELKEVDPGIYAVLENVWGPR